ncbi:hypothetical protein PB2503_06997 [Parvularcula bermudensis HTCC2503]|uniref:Uncharacterized protein n=1 Tax=Parvularcula bermudensis (strain ATCC BAA-594 / HTCC2503 / KCTC 12087) TaxID=314260 RepID=E0TE90_PARBH|nr:hypothetical protein PB2503_06997 [Parvularcula bermudensis HTCC2503]
MVALPSVNVWGAMPRNYYTRMTQRGASSAFAAMMIVALPECLIYATGQ